MSKELSGLSKFYEISEDTISIFEEIVSKKLLNDVSFQFIGNDSQKTIVKVNKLPEQYEYILRKHILVTINETLMSRFDEEAIHILMEQEIDKIAINIETGKVKLIKPDISTFSSLIKKWGIEKISRANQLSEISSELTISTDFDNDFIS